MRWTLVSILATVGALVAAAPASAGTLTVQNACFLSFNSSWQDMNLDWAGTGTPNPAAPGSGVTLTGATVHSRLPQWVGEYGANLEILKPGLNEIPTKVWVALAGDNTSQAVQVLQLQTIARTTVTPNADGTNTVTPIEVTIPLPDTAWTAGTIGAAGFRQAGAGALPPIPAGPGGAMVTPKGSVFIQPTLAGGASMPFDCQPGTRGDGFTPVLSTAGLFESVLVQAGATQVPAPKPVPAVSVRTTALKAKGRSVKVALSCTAADCNGALTLKAGSKLAGREEVLLHEIRREADRDADADQIRAEGAQAASGRRRSRCASPPPAARPSRRGSRCDEDAPDGPRRRAARCRRPRTPLPSA